MAAKTKTKIKKTDRMPWTKEDQKRLRAYSHARTAVAEISKKMKRTVGALRQQALKLEIPLGERTRGHKIGARRGATTGSRRTTKAKAKAA